MRPYIYRTYDGGATWALTVNGLPDHGPVNVVREDPEKPGLLFAGTERAVYFSIDDGDHWHSLRMNMPATSVRDLVIHGDDLVVGTHGRSIWILDNITPLRALAEAAPASPAFLFTPPNAVRVRWNMFSDTPLPPEEPTGQNPPEGVVLDYVLNARARDVTLEILDGEGALIRRFSSRDRPEGIDTTSLPHPTYWIRPHQVLSLEPGHHRIAWDLRLEAPRGARRSFSIAAVYRNTPSGPRGPFVHPGRYRVRLTVDGQIQERILQVSMDPRVSISDTDLKLQTDLSMICYQAYHELQDIREAIDARLKTGTGTEQREKMEARRGEGGPEDADILYGSVYETPLEEETVVALQYKFLHFIQLLQSADARPTAQVTAGVNKLKKTLEGVLSRWEALR